MHILTADGYRTFYNPATPDYPPAHVAIVREFVELINRPTIAGWKKKYPLTPPTTVEFELRNQVRLTAQAPVAHPNLHNGAL